jgi:hypothetical protein
MAGDVQFSPDKMKTPWAYDEILVQLAIENKASLQRLARLIAKFEAAARRDGVVAN